MPLESRRTFLSLLATGTIATGSGCLDRLPALENSPGSEKRSPITVCEITGLSKMSAEHEITIVIREKQQRLVMETSRVSPDENSFKVRDGLPITSAKQSLTLSVKAGGTTETFDFASVNARSVKIFINISVSEGRPNIGFYYRTMNC